MKFQCKAWNIKQAINAITSVTHCNSELHHFQWHYTVLDYGDCGRGLNLLAANLAPELRNFWVHGRHFHIVLHQLQHNSRHWCSKNHRQNLVQINHSVEQQQRNCCIAVFQKIQKKRCFWYRKLSWMTAKSAQLRWRFCYNVDANTAYLHAVAPEWIGKWGGGHRSSTKCQNFFLVMPLHFFGSESTISRFGEHFRNG